MATWFWLSFQWLGFLVATNPHFGCSPVTKIQSQEQKQKIEKKTRVFFALFKNGNLILVVISMAIIFEHN